MPNFLSLNSLLHIYCIDVKGVVASYQAAVSEEYSPLEVVFPVLNWSIGDPGHIKSVSEDEIL